MKDDHGLDALEYAMRPKEPRHLRGWRKVWSWLRSRPLARVRRTLATRQRARDHYHRGVFTPEIRERLTRTDALAQDLKRMYRAGMWAPGSEHLRQLQEEFDERDAT